MALTASGVNLVSANIGVDAAGLIDLFDAFGAEVDRGGLAVFRCAHLKPCQCIFFDTVGKPTDGLGRRGACIPLFPVCEDTVAMSDHPCHCSATGQEVAVTERI